MDLRDFVALCMLGVAAFEYIVILLKDDEITKLKRRLNAMLELEAKIKSIRETVAPPKRRK